MALEVEKPTWTHRNDRRLAVLTRRTTHTLVWLADATIFIAPSTTQEWRCGGIIIPGTTRLTLRGVTVVLFSIGEAPLPPIHVTIQTPAGPLRLAYLDVGSGRPLLLLHGMFGDHLDWAPVIEPLSQRFRVLAVDLPGFGDSEKPDADYDGSLFVCAIRGLLAHLQLPCVTLVGNSFGGLLALMFTLENPQSVDALVLVGSGGLQPFDEAARERAERLFSESSLLALTPAMQDAMFSPVFAADSETRQCYLDKQNAKLNREDFRAYARALARTIRFVMRTSCDERLPDIQCRTLLLWGDRDAVIPAEVAVRAAGRIPRCRVTLLAGCGHAPQLDCPGAFTQAIEEFVGGRSAAV